MSDTAEKRTPTEQEMQVQAAVKTLSEIMDKIYGQEVVFALVINGKKPLLEVLGNVDSYGLEGLLSIGLSKLYGGGTCIIRATPLSKADDQTKVH